MCGLRQPRPEIGHSGAAFAFARDHVTACMRTRLWHPRKSSRESPSEKGGPMSLTTLKASKLDQLRAMTTIVADTGDLGAVARLKPVDCTTNPTIVLKAIDNPEYRDVVEEALTWGRKRSGDAVRVAAATADRLAVSVGVELL